MSRRAYPTADVYEERERDFYSRPRPERNYDDLEIDIRETRTRGPERRADTVISDRRTERAGPRQPDFLREDYGKTTAGALVVREDIRREEIRREDDVISRAPSGRRRSIESMRSRAPERIEKEEIVIRERDRRVAPLPYPSSERGDFREEEIVFRDRARSRGPPPATRSKEEIDITIRRDDDARSRAPPPPRSEYRERDVEEIRFRRGGGPPSRTVIEKEEIDIRERRVSPPQSEYRGRDTTKEEIDIRIRETDRSIPAPRARSASRGALVAKKEEEWIVRRRREPSPPPPPRDYEKEEIIIRRKERSPSPEPIREPTPPPPPPPVEPIHRPPIIQEVITHHRHIDHGVERARSPTPPPAPAPPSPPTREEDLEIEIHRTGTRNGKFYDEDIIFEREVVDRKTRDDRREQSRRRSMSASTRRRASPSPVRRRYEDDIAGEADYYNRRVSSRAYPGEAYNGATRDWGLVDVPPGTERVRLDGVGGGAQEITWQRYNGERRSKFITGDRVYEPEFGNGYVAAPPPAPAPLPPPSLARGEERVEELRITERRTIEEKPPTRVERTKDKMWTEITKDLVIKEAIDEMGYSFEETDDFFYVIEYLRYEDVLRLVELTEDIRRERRERIREIQWEREQVERVPPPPKMLSLPAPPPPPMSLAGGKSVYDERIYEREYHYDREGGRRRGGR